jgi:hypothetical protein
MPQWISRFVDTEVCRAGLAIVGQAATRPREPTLGEMRDDGLVVLPWPPAHFQILIGPLLPTLVHGRARQRPHGILGQRLYEIPSAVDGNRILDR